MKCPQCNEANIPLGALGRTNHYRCRACGWMYSQTRKPPAQRATPRTAHECLPGHNDWNR